MHALVWSDHFVRELGPSQPYIWKGKTVTSNIHVVRK